MTEKPKYAHVNEVQAGTVLVADGGFTCLHDGDVLTVQKDTEVADSNPALPELGLFVPCSDGKHFLDGQLDDGEVYIGLRLHT